jgi:hypothetical protein
MWYLSIRKYPTYGSLWIFYRAIGNDFPEAVRAYIFFKKKIKMEAGSKKMGALIFLISVKKY